MEFLLHILLFFSWHSLSFCQIKTFPSYQQRNDNSAIKSPQNIIEHPQNWKEANFLNYKIPTIQTANTNVAKQNKNNATVNKHFMNPPHSSPVQPNQSKVHLPVIGDNIRSHNIPLPFQSVQNMNYIPQKNIAQTEQIYGNSIRGTKLNTKENTNSKTFLARTIKADDANAVGNQNQLNFAPTKSSYMSYEPKFTPSVREQIPDGDYYTQYLLPGDNPIDELSEKLEDFGGEDEEEYKEKYFYHKAKFISTAVSSLYAFGLAMIGISVATTTYIANLNTGRKKRDLEDTEENSYFGNASSCLARVMCEIEQMDGVFENKDVERQGSVGSYKTDANYRRDLPGHQKQPQQFQQTKQLTQEKSNEGRDRRRRRQKRRIFSERNCGEIYNTCPINFTLYWNMWKMFSG